LLFFDRPRQVGSIGFFMTKWGDAQLWQRLDWNNAKMWHARQFDPPMLGSKLF